METHILPKDKIDPAFFATVIEYEKARASLLSKY